jgi:hypothetical protein
MLRQNWSERIMAIHATFASAKFLRTDLLTRVPKF